MRHFSPNHMETPAEISPKLNAYIKESTQEFYETFLYLSNPLVTSKGLLRRWRKEHFSKGTEDFFDLPPKEIKKLAKAMTGLVTFKYDELIEPGDIIDKVKDTFSGELGEVFSKTIDNFGNLSDKERDLVFNNSMKEASAKLQELRFGFESKATSKDGYEFFVTAQLLYVLEQVINRLVEEKLPDDEKDTLSWYVAIEIFRLIGLKEGKLTINDIQDDILVLSQYIDQKYPIEVDDRLVNALIP